MKYYFTIQYRRFQRLINELKLPLLLVLILVLSFYVFGTYFLFQKTIYAAYVVFGLQVILLLKLSLKNRVKFIAQLYKKKEVRTIRLIENLALTIPLMGINLFYLNWELALAQCFICVGFVFVQSQPLIARTLPTPFKKNPFEFVSGFRRFIGYIFASYVVFVLGVIVGNVNISYFSMIVLWLVVLSFYSLPEDITYVRIFSLTPKQFILKKVALAFKQSLLLLLPLLMFSVVLDITNYYIPLVIYALGFFNLVNYIFSKYADLPSEIGLPNAVVVGISFMIPPLLLLSPFYLYAKAINNLKSITQ